MPPFFWLFCRRPAPLPHYPNHGRPDEGRQQHGSLPWSALTQRSAPFAEHAWMLSLTAAGGRSGS